MPEKKPVEFNETLNVLLENLFGDLDKNSIKQIFDSLRQVELQTGDYLFHQGEDQNDMYILISGRLRAISESNGDLLILGDIGAGETVGELGFFTKETRTASVLAIRNSIVLEITQDKFIELLSINPKLASPIIQLIIRRFKRNTFELNKGIPPKNIAIINLQKHNNIGDLTKIVQSSFQEMEVPVQIHDAQSYHSDHPEELFGSLEQHEGLNILLCDNEHQEWANQCLIYADLIVVATDFNADEQIYEIEKYSNIYVKNILNKKTYLLLLHPPEGGMPTNTNRWLKDRNVDLHIHVRQNNHQDIRRFCRIISNRAIGLVLGGGGAKGFAHLGVVQALQERGIEIDFLGGTSAGAIFGISMSFTDFDFKKINQLNDEAVRRKLTSGDYALPMVSLMTGNKVKGYLKDTFGEHHLEDIWVNSFCVSTNFSKSALHIHDSGLVWKQVLASMSIPGIFPPVVIDKHLHVDGGVMDNLPIEHMYHYPVDTIIAVSLSSLEVREVNCLELPSSGILAIDKLRKKKQYKVPGIASIIINSLNANSTQKQEQSKDMASHYIPLELKGFGLLDDKKWKQIMQKGYEQTIAYLDSIKS